MEEEEDDFYGDVATGKDNGTPQFDVEQDVKADRMDVSEGDEEDEEEDSDDDVQFTLEKPEGAKSAAPSRPGNKQVDRTVSSEAVRTVKSSTPARQEPSQAGQAAAPTAVKGTLTYNGKEGKDFPEIRTSKVDVDGIPQWPANGKPITEVDIDADLAENSKPWRLPGTDQTDFFNYGFDEYTWTQYCVRQQMMSGTINEQKNADAQMKALFGGGAPGGGMPGMPPGMPMPDPEQLMQMVSQGVIPPEFAQQMMQQMGGGGMGQFQGGGGGGFGSGQNSVSPQPQAGQGFQPPTGPSGGQGQQGGFQQGNMDGYSSQQMAIMQQEQQGPMQGGGGGGGGGRGRRRGRGFY